MATYLVLVNWTDQGAAGFDQATERVDHEEEIRKRAGVTLKGIYWTQGPYDLAAIIEADDDESVASRSSPSSASRRPRDEGVGVGEVEVAVVGAEPLGD